MHLGLFTISIFILKTFITYTKALCYKAEIWGMLWKGESKNRNVISSNAKQTFILKGLLCNGSTPLQKENKILPPIYKPNSGSF